MDNGEINANGFPEWEKDPGDEKLIGLDWAGWLAKRGLTNLATVSWTLPTGITARDVSNTATVASNYFLGGTRGRRYRVTCAVTAGSPVQREEQSIEILIKDG